MTEDLKVALKAIEQIPHLRKRPPQSHNETQREVSPEDLRGLIRACATPQHEPTKAQIYVLGILRDELLPEWVSDRPRVRRRFDVALRHFLAHGDATKAARVNLTDRPGVTANEAWEQSARRQCSRFLQDAARILNEGTLYRHECRGETRPKSDRQTLRDDLDGYCEQTHRQSGGDGRTPNVELATARGTNCAACQILRGLFGSTGWADELEERARKAERAKGSRMNRWQSKEKTTAGS